MQIDFLYYMILLLLFVGQLVNVYGSFLTSSASKSIWRIYIAVLPYMVIQKLITTLGIYIIDKYDYISNNNVVLILLIFQFVNTILISYVIMHIPVYFSDAVGCLLFALGYYTSIYNSFTNTYLL